MNFLYLPYVLTSSFIGSVRINSEKRLLASSLSILLSLRVYQGAFHWTDFYET